MNKLLYQVLDNLNEGIVILNEYLQIMYWNYYMEDVTSCAIHKRLLNNSDYFNMKVTRIENEGKHFIQLEFINVTSQWVSQTAACSMKSPPVCWHRQKEIKACWD